MPKFNLNWMYMIIALMLLGLWWTNQGGATSKNISYDEFQQYVRNGYVSKVIGYDDNSVEFYVKPNFVGQVFKQDSSRVGKNPMVLTEAPSRENLDNFLQKEKEEAHFDGSLTYDKKTNYFGSFLINVLPIVFLVGLWIFFMRRMSGGGGGGAGGVFNV
ncbi:MAG: ATP-dependent metallopeptidase FtsH/Yme1/Tma family protein, partial [Bacteroides sp.]